jgi:type II restriction/modification system DNA methylase subunit YeeA
MRRNGFEAARNPVLRSLNTIENRDAVLAPDGSRADWPKADVVVGNPPFLGSGKFLKELGEDYSARLRTAWVDLVPGAADLVAFWFAKAWVQMQDGNLSRAGLVSTNSIRGGANREVLKHIVEGGRIFDAWADEDWTQDGAAVRVSMTCFDKAKASPARLNGAEVLQIHADLTGAGQGTDLTKALPLQENLGQCYEGMKKYGPFEVEGDLAREWLVAPLNVNGRPNSDVVKPWIAGRDITTRPQDRWVIDFGVNCSESDAALYELPFAHLAANARDLREKDRSNKTASNWWLFERSRPPLRARISKLSRYLATVVVSKHRLFSWLPTSVLPSNLLDAIARDDDTTFGILHSKFHELWALRMGTFLGVGNDPRYTPSTTFETFPFPEGLTPNIPATDYASDPRAQKIAVAAARLNELRESWLNPADQVIRVPEVVPGYPERILPKDEEAAKVLKTRTLTNLYNQRPTWLQNAHAALDEAVAGAYGWGDDWRAGVLTDDEILARLFKLNQERAGK